MSGRVKEVNDACCCGGCAVCCWCLCEAGDSSNEDTDDDETDGLARGEVNVLSVTVIRAVPFGEDLLMLLLLLLLLKLSSDLHMTAAIIELA